MKRLIPTAVPRTLAQLSEGEERITTGAGQFGDALSDAPRQGSASTMRGYRNCPTVRKPDRPKLTARVRALSVVPRRCRTKLRL